MLQGPRWLAGSASERRLLVNSFSPRPGLLGPHPAKAAGHCPPLHVGSEASRPVQAWAFGTCVSRLLQQGVLFGSSPPWPAPCCWPIADEGEGSLPPWLWSVQTMLSRVDRGSYLGPWAGLCAVPEAGFRAFGSGGCGVQRAPALSPRGAVGATLPLPAFSSVEELLPAGLLNQTASVCPASHATLPPLVKV